jgi:hypothetical protein
MNTINTWSIFKTGVMSKKGKLIFNNGLTDDEKKNHQEFIDKYHIPDELLEILCDSNGQYSKSESVFLEIKTGILGLNFLHYNFLSLTDIIKIYSFIQSYSKSEIDMDLIPFARLEKSIEENVLVVFTIHTIDKTIYKTQFYEWDRFITHFEFRSEKFATDLNEFLESQILWYSVLS